VDGVGAGPGGDLDDLVNVQVGLRRSAAAQRIRLVRDLDVQGIEIGVGVDGDAGEPGVPAGARYPDRDLAAVRDQNFPQFGLLKEIGRSWVESRSVG
jgi:hypothetical protein